MSVLKSMKLTSVSADVTTDPVLIKRKEVVARLQNQIELLKDSKFTKKTKTRTGEEKTHKVLPMWKHMPDGTVAFVMRVGFRPIQWDKNSNAIACKSLDELPAVIEQLITATRAGELDAFIMSKEAKKLVAKGQAK